MDAGFLQSVIKYLLIGTVAFGVNFFLALLGRRRARDRDGWRYLTPGPMMWIAVVLGALATAFFCLLYFGGSSRPDADTQMKWVLGLAAAFDLMTMAIAYTIIVEEVRWNDTHLERRTFLFGKLRMSWHELAAFGFEPASGYWWVRGFERPRIRFSPYCNGFHELCAKIVEHMPTNLPPADIALVLEHAIPARAAARR